MRDVVKVLVSGGVPPGDGTLTVERRWVDRLLPDWELLTATERAYSRLVLVIREAHRLLDGAQCDLPARSRDCITADLFQDHPGCMSAAGSAREVSLDLATLTELNMRLGKLELDPKLARLSQERYGSLEVSGDAIARVPLAFEMGKRILEIDGHLVTSAWLLHGGKVCDLQALVFVDQKTKRLAMNYLATRVRQLDADGVVLMGEAWLAIPESGEDLSAPDTIPARDRPNRLEALQVLGITSDGRSTGRTAIFCHTDQGIVVGEADPLEEAGALNLVRPILRVWEIDSR
jgi:hypothetical protein